MKKKLQLAVCSMALLVFSACSTIKVTTDYDRSADFAKYKAFDFVQINVSGAISELNQNRIINAIKAEMEKKGFTQDEANPDFLVNATAILQDKKSVSADTYGYGGVYRPYRWGVGATTTSFNVYEYQYGSLIIDVVDAVSNQLVWQGTGDKEIDSPAKDPDTAIANAIAQILAGFPPGVSK